MNREATALVSAMGGQLPAFRVACGQWGRYQKTTFGARVALTV